jgi:hypothetical protein
MMDFGEKVTYRKIQEIFKEMSSAEMLKSAKKRRRTIAQLKAKASFKNDESVDVSASVDDEADDEEQDDDSDDNETDGSSRSGKGSTIQEIDFGLFVRTLHQARHEGRATAFASLVDKVEAKILLAQGQALFSVFLLLTFLVLVSVSSTIFHFLQCEKFNDGDEVISFLYVDYTIECQSQRYLSFKPYAVLMIMIYPVGSKSDRSKVPFCFYFLFLCADDPVLCDG